MVTQIAFFAVQSVLQATDIPSGISLVIFSQCLGGSLGLSIAQNIFSNSLSQQLRGIGGLEASAVIAAGASAEGIRTAVPAVLLAMVQQAYDTAFTTAFLVAVTAAGTAFICSPGMEQKRIEKKR